MLEQLWPPQAGVPPPDAMNAPSTRFAEAASRLAGGAAAVSRSLTRCRRRASNEWAVDGRHSATGAPLLAGDPHLAFSFPGIWYLARIDMPGRVLAGATAPGVPFLVLGHNGKIAWTFTTTGADVQDIFVETPAGPGEYQTPSGPTPFAVREERIKVRGQADVVLTVRETRHGPVISDLDHPDGPILAVAMGNLQPNDTAAAGLLALNRAGSVQEAGAAAAAISSPVQNLLVADAKTIGLFVTGRVPIRKAGDGSAPVPGDGSHDWIGWASGEQLPHIVSPASGRLVNANEPVWQPDFPVFMGRDTFGPWRANRIRELLGTVGPAHPRRISPRCRWMSSTRSPDRCCRFCWRFRDHRHGGEGAWSAAGLGRIGRDGLARAADLQRLDGGVLQRRAAPCGPDSRRGCAGFRLRGVRAVPGGSALVRRRL